MLDRCPECGKRDWRIGYYLRLPFNLWHCLECKKVFWSIKRRNEHVLEKHPESSGAWFIKLSEELGQTTPLTLLIKTIDQRKG